MNEDGVYTVSGMCNIRQFNHEFSTDLDTDEYDNLAEYLLAHFNHVPETGEKYQLDSSLEFRVLESDGKSIKKIQEQSSAMLKTPLGKILPIIKIIMFASLLQGISMEYDISSLVLHVADLKIVRDPGARVINVYVSSKTASAIYPKLNNQYRVKYDDHYRPLEYTRIVDQGKTQDRVVVTLRSLHQHGHGFPHW
jgi:hypothetical protein